MENKMTPVWDLLKNSFSAYQTKFKILTKLAAFNLIPFGLSLLAGGVSAGYFVIFGVRNNNFQTLPFPVLPFLFLMLLGLIIALISIYVSFGVLAGTFYVIKEGSNEASPWEFFKKGWANMGSFAWVAFLAGLVMFGGFILFIIPGIIFSIWFSQSLYVFIFEGTKGSEALKKSKALAKGYFWPLLGRFLVLGIIGWLVAHIKIFGPLINVLFLAPFGIVYANLIYQDLKRIKGQN